MGILIGMDEAGLGPNLGPYVVSATVWETPGATTDSELWQAFHEVVTSIPDSGDERLHIGDSKAVFQPGKGIQALERGVLCALGLLSNVRCDTDRTLRRSLSADADDGMELEPWYSDEDLSLPLESPRDDIERMTQRWREVMERTGIRLLTVRSLLLEPLRFNRLLDRFQNKAEALSWTSLRLLHRVASCVGEGDRGLVVCDKHGGRNRYDRLLSNAFEGTFVFRLRESASLSAYRVGDLEVRFQPRAESHFPVALASMVSKYLRELAMSRLNAYWARRIPNLRPTQGYPTDAKRFRAEIGEEFLRLGLPETILWRLR